MAFQENLLHQRDVLGKEIPFLRMFYYLCLSIVVDISFLWLIVKSGIGIKVSKKSPVILLMFADDCIIFYKANSYEARQIKAILKDYCNVSHWSIFTNLWSSSLGERRYYGYF